MNFKVVAAIICLAAIAVTAMATDHNGVTVQSVISFILILAGYEIAKESTKENSKEDTE
jgi:hypothetical protein